MMTTTLHSINVSINSLKIYKFISMSIFSHKHKKLQLGMHHLFYITTEADSHPL